jgi:membrane peptidoglycan carboxypeptidase
VLNPHHVYLMTSILSDLEARRPMFGTSAELLSLTGRPAAAKTGTTNDYRDAWTVGYTPDLAVGAWVGNADYKPMQKVAGGIGAAPIWHNVMQRSLQGKPVQSFAEPPGIQRLRICADTGTLPAEACPAQREELFAAGQGPLPAQYDLHQRIRIDKVSGRLATEFTPPDRIEERNVMLFPAKYRAWAEAHGIPQPAIELPTYAFPPELRLDAPANSAQLAGNTQITGRVRLPQPLTWRVEYGVGPNPLGWGVIAGPNSGDREGPLADWDTAVPVQAHSVRDFSVRLAAYDPAISDYPVAVSNAVYVTIAEPTATPTVPSTATATPTRTPTRQATATATRTPTALASPIASPTATRTPISPTSTPAPTARATASPTAPSAATATPTSPVATATVVVVPASPTPTATAPAGTAANPIRAIIAQPQANRRVSGAVEITGSADGKGFAGYQLEFAAGSQPPAGAWQQLGVPQLASVSDGVLGIWQTPGLAPGAYWLRLEVFDANGLAATTQVRVEVAR